MAVKPIGSIKMTVDAGSKPPYDLQREAELAAGRARVEHHAARERMLAAARASEVPEEVRVEAAKKANSDL